MTTVNSDVNNLYSLFLSNSTWLPYCKVSKVVGEAKTMSVSFWENQKKSCDVSYSGSTVVEMRLPRIENSLQQTDEILVVANDVN